MMEKLDAHSTAANVSRRDFLKFTAGSLVALPAVAGGYVVPATTAYAESATTGTQDDDTGLDDITKITMVSASQVGIVVVDIADEYRAKIKGAHVVLTSRFNKKMIEGDTNDDGEVIFDVRDLAERPEYSDVDELESYAFNGTIKVTCEGYREFVTALVRVNGGGGLRTMIRSLDDKNPFPRMVSLNEWDILYTKNAFACTPQNDNDQTITMEFMQLENRDATVYLKHASTDTTLLSASGTPKNGTLTLSATGKYLMRGSADEFPIVIEKYDMQADVVLDPSISFFNLEMVQGNDHYVWPINLLICETDIETNMEEYSASLMPFNTVGSSNTGLDLKWPVGLPIVGGGSIKPFMPAFGMNLSINPWGYLQFTAQLSSWGYKRDNGKKQRSSIVERGAAQARLRSVQRSL